VAKAGSILLPRGLRPTNPLLLPSGKEEKSLAKMIVSKYRQKEALKQKKEEEALKQSLEQAKGTASMGQLDPEVERQIKNMLSLSSSTGRQAISKRSSTINRPSTEYTADGMGMGIGMASSENIEAADNMTRSKSANEAVKGGKSRIAQFSAPSNLSSSASSASSSAANANANANANDGLVDIAQARAIGDTAGVGVRFDDTAEENTGRFGLSRSAEAMHSSSSNNNHNNNNHNHLQELEQLRKEVAILRIEKQEEKVTHSIYHSFRLLLLLQTCLMITIFSLISFDCLIS
jgi:hypothetical protein